MIPLDYYLRGAVKDKCYVDKSETIDALKDIIREAIVEIQLHTIDNVPKNWTDCFGYCMASRGSHLNEIIIHYKPEGLYFKKKKKNLGKYSVVFFKAFRKKRSLADPVHKATPNDRVFFKNFSWEAYTVV